MDVTKEFTPNAADPDSKTLKEKLGSWKIDLETDVLLAYSQSGWVAGRNSGEWRMGWKRGMHKVSGQLLNSLKSL